MTSDKNNIRQFAKRHRDQIQVGADWDAQIADNFLQSIPSSEESIISVYYPISSEVDIAPLVEKLWARGQTVCLPVIQGKAQPLLFAEWRRATQMTKGQMGIMEPVERHYVDPDIVVVPLLAFDQQGNRIGYGQGHYDATLADLRARKQVWAVGAAYAEQAVLLALPREPHDQKLDFVVTEQRVFDFRG
ncbi:MAG: 5-formyltetrahydrofolate cyclo-ligase [Alphaproteobacteria bacterium]|nr:5-formyltetrahydrofolate cyclo-ligase [Alphaproteobacteria bacterium]